MEDLRITRGREIAKELGLKKDSQFWFYCDEIYKMLGESVEVSGVWPADGQFEMHREKYQWATHTALAIAIRPIEQKIIAEDFLRLACRVFNLSPGERNSELFIDHANRLLAKKERK